MGSFRCRYYKDRFPKEGDVVIINMLYIAKTCAYAHLLEYDKIQGVIPFSELSRRRIRSVNKVIRVYNPEPAIVTRVDREKRDIELSRLRVTAEDVEKFRERYEKAKIVNSILITAATFLYYNGNRQLEELYQKTAWHFEEKYKEAFPLDIFKQSLFNYNILAECDLDMRTMNILLSSIRSEFAYQAVEKGDFLAYLSYHGFTINTIKAAYIDPLLSKLMPTSTPGSDLMGLNVALEAIQTNSPPVYGMSDVKMDLKVVVTVDESKLARQMERATLEEIDETDDFSGRESREEDRKVAHDTQDKD